MANVVGFRLKTRGAGIFACGRSGDARVDRPQLEDDVNKFRVLVVASFLVFGIALQAAAQEWIHNTPQAPPFPDLRGFQGTAAILDTGSNRMTIFGGMLNAGLAGNRLLNDVWVLTNASAQAPSQWINLISDGRPGSPSARQGHSAVYDAGSNRMMVFGGCAGGCLPTLNDVWVLTNANGLGGTPTWIQLSPAGAPPAPRTRHTAVYDNANNRMIVFAGQNGGGSGCSTFPDAWILTNANGLGGTPVWTQLSTAGGLPPGQYAASAVYDPTNNLMTVFAGFGFVNGVCQATNAVWVLSNANGLGGIPTWTNLVPEAADGAPGGRGFHTAVYDVANNIMTIFSGGSAADVWTLLNANGLGGPPTWLEITPPTGSIGSPGGRNSHVAVYDPASNRMTIYSGGNLDAIFGVGGTNMVLTHANGM